MFENDYTLVGKHATYTKVLVTASGVFERYIDVYMNGAILGFLHGKTNKRDTESKDRARIYADAFANERLRCDFIYRIIMLLDETTGLTTEQRIDRAFRDDAKGEKDNHRNNMELFNSYVLGGIDVLYQMFIEGCTTREDYINKIYEEVTGFKNEIEDYLFDNGVCQVSCRI